MASGPERLAISVHGWPDHFVVGLAGTLLGSREQFLGTDRGARLARDAIIATFSAVSHTVVDAVVAKHREHDMFWMQWARRYPGATEGAKLLAQRISTDVQPLQRAGYD